jgi:hypothetical protein
MTQVTLEQVRQMGRDDAAEAYRESPAACIGRNWFAALQDSVGWVAVCWLFGESVAENLLCYTTGMWVKIVAYEAGALQYLDELRAQQRADEAQVEIDRAAGL